MNHDFAQIIRAADVLNLQFLHVFMSITYQRHVARTHENRIVKWIYEYKISKGWMENVQQQDLKETEVRNWSTKERPRKDLNGEEL